MPRGTKPKPKTTKRAVAKKKVAAPAVAKAHSKSEAKRIKIQQEAAQKPEASVSAENSRYSVCPQCNEPRLIDGHCENPNCDFVVED